jgi:OOP family OmpA-OmpF porin
MVVAGPQRGLFLACLIVGVGSLLALDLDFAPAAFAGADTADAAPATSTAHVPVALDGGPPISARVVIPAPARVPTIVARFDSASKEPSDQSAIRTLATAMIEDHDVMIVLEGHSDTRGGEDYNHTISLERANWVKSRLVELGVSPDRIETVGLGATRPLRSDNPDAPSVNRRVEVRWLGSAAREAPIASPIPARSAAAPIRDASPQELRGKTAQEPTPRSLDASVPAREKHESAPVEENAPLEKPPPPPPLPGESFPPAHGEN